MLLQSSFEPWWSLSLISSCLIFEHKNNPKMKQLSRMRFKIAYDAFEFYGFVKYWNRCWFNQGNCLNVVFLSNFDQHLLQYRQNVVVFKELRLDYVKKLSICSINLKIWWRIKRSFSILFIHLFEYAYHFILLFAFHLLSKNLVKQNSLANIPLFVP